MFTGQYETHADMINAFARWLLNIFAQIRQLYDVVGFVPQFPLG